ncbi:MAG: AAA family ATPase [Myxococcales bacterium]|nr:AAA family ATPase [Myxococcales bacterium]
MYRVFMSYSHQDAGRVERIRKRLAEEDLEVLIDHEQITAGEPLTPRLRELISQSHVVLLFLTQWSESSDFVKLEFECARSQGVHVIPVVLGDLRRWPWWAEKVGHTAYVSGEYLVEGLLNEIARRVVRTVTRAHVISFFNMKGGVGKTTLAAQFAARIARGSASRRAHSVLMIDLDPQQSLTELFVGPTTIDKRAATNATVVGLCEPMLVGKPRRSDFDPLMQGPTETPAVFDALPVRLGGAEGGLFDVVVGDFAAVRYFDEFGVSRHHVVHNFEAGLRRFRSHYDFIVIDCNPSVSPLTHCALRSDHLFVPITPDNFGRRGFVFVDKFLERHLSDVPRPHISAMFNKVHKRQVPRGQAALMRRIREGDDDFAPGASLMAPTLMTTEVPHDRRLVPTILSTLDDANRTASKFLEQTSGADSVLEPFVDEFYARIVHGNPT